MTPLILLLAALTTFGGGASAAVVAALPPAAPSTTWRLPVAARPAEPAGRTSQAIVASMRAAPAATNITVSYGKLDTRGCARAVVRSGDERIAGIASSVAVCSTLRKQKLVFGRLYFDWVTTRTTGKGSDTITKTRTDLWTTDGTSVGTRRVITLLATSGTGVDTCESRWARAGYRAIAGAQWCRIGATRAWASGDVAIILDERIVRHLPIPRMLGFQMAARHIVTTGEDGGGRELWVHDGRMTRVDLWPGPHGSYPRQLTDLGSTVSFIANDGTGPARWITDGTVKGTHKVGPLS